MLNTVQLRYQCHVAAVGAALATLLSPYALYAQESVPSYVIVFDAYMTPAAGAQGLLTIQHLLASAEDKWLPRKIGEERSRPALALGILYRGSKLLGLDVPQDHFLMVEIGRASCRERV